VHASRSTATPLLLNALSTAAWPPQRLDFSFTGTWQPSLRAMATRQFKADCGHPANFRDPTRSGVKRTLSEHATKQVGRAQC